MAKSKVSELDNLKDIKKEEKIIVRDAKKEKKKAKKEEAKIEITNPNDSRIEDEIKQEVEKKEAKPDEGFADTGFGIDVFAQH